MLGGVLLDWHTDLVAWRQVLVLVAGVPLLTVQQQEVDHLLLVVTGERRQSERCSIITRRFK